MAVSQIGEQPGRQPRPVFARQRHDRTAQHLQQGKANFDGLKAGWVPVGRAVHEGQFCQLRFVE